MLTLIEGWRVVVSTFICTCICCQNRDVKVSETWARLLTTAPEIWVSEKTLLSISPYNAMQVFAGVIYCISNYLWIQAAALHRKLWKMEGGHLWVYLRVHTSKVVFLPRVNTLYNRFELWSNIGVTQHVFAVVTPGIILTVSSKAKTYLW